MKVMNRALPVSVESAAAPALSAYCTSSSLFEKRLDALLPPAEHSPQVLHRAMRYAVFSGGKRLRPLLLIAVAAACGAEDASSAEAQLVLNAACAVELLHCASLVHDDLPVFDDSPMRRGRPTVHMMFGEPIAILAGDALLALAFECIAESPIKVSRRAMGILRLVGSAVGSSEGIIGGQSLEQEWLPNASSTSPPHFAPGLVERYHAMKSAALFRLSAAAGAMAVGSTQRGAWGRVGHLLGLAFQLADDLGDVGSSSTALGKPTGRDAALGRPNAALLHGQAETRKRMEALIREATTLAASLSIEPQPILGLLNQAGANFGLAP